MNLQEPNAPPGFSLRDFIADRLSLEVSINSSLNAPKIPFFPANTLPILDLCFLDSKINAEAVALITDVTPPDCA